MRMNQGMTEAQIRYYAPSVYAEKPADHTSHKYKFIPTVQVLDVLKGAGWQVVAASEQRVRTSSKVGYQKHMLRLRHESMVGRLLKVDEMFPEMGLVNSHDGTSSYIFEAGLHRCFCDNQCYVSESVIASQRVRHIGYNDMNVLESAEKIITDTPKMIESVNEMREIQLKPELQHAFAKAAIDLKWDTENGSAPVEPAQLNQARRWDDRGDSLWHTFNRVQENLIKGGVRGRDANNRRRRTRAVTSINEDRKLNKALWTLAEEVKKFA